MPISNKIFIVLFLLFLGVLPTQAQILRPISWDNQLSVEKASVGDEIDLIFTAKIQKDWYLYSSDFDPELGPQVTEFTFTPHPSYKLVGGIVPVAPKTKYDEIWEGDVTYFVGKGEFRQKVKVLSADFQVSVSASFQVCTDVDGRCIPLEEDFSFSKLQVIPVEEESSNNTINKREEKTATDDATPSAATVPSTVNPTKDVDVYEDDTVAVSQENAETAAEKGMTLSEDAGTQPQVYTPDLEEEGTSLWSFMIYAFLFGLAAIFTPCVFPMIPLTVSFFTKKGEAKSKGIGQALLYGISIIGIYTLVGAIVAPLGGPSVANLISTHWLPNMLFFVIFLVFALSFFGMFDIVLPSKFVNKIDRKADQGGFIGVFFMAFTLVLVSFSCTGPLVGSILVESAGGAMLKPIAGMFAFSLAFALPFTLFAIFPQWLSSLPKSGGWLNAVKVTLGFVELALAFKFLSMVDLVYHWNWFDRDINIAIWIAIASFMGLYYLGKIQLPHDTPIEKLSVPRMLLALICFSFVVYLIPGMFGAPLKALSGILPPQTRHSFDIEAIVRENTMSSSGGIEQSKPFATVQFDVKYEDKFELPHNLSGFFDYQQGLEVARELGKPVFIDFTGHGCANCRKMEDNVWADPSVLRRLQQDYVVIALYVDDPTRLPEEEWVQSEYDGKLKKTIGQVNMDFQITRFQNNAQPFYVLLDHNGELLAKPKAYDLNVQNFVDFLDGGIREFNTRNENLAQK